MKKRIATLALLAGLVAAPGFVADAHADRHCDRRDGRYDRYDGGYRYGGYYDGYAYDRYEPRYRYTRAYDYDYAPRRAFVLPFPPPFLSFHFGHRW